MICLLLILNARITGRMARMEQKLFSIPTRRLAQASGLGDQVAGVDWPGHQKSCLDTRAKLMHCASGPGTRLVHTEL